MPNSAATTAALRKVRNHQALKRQAVTTGFGAARDNIKAAVLAAVEARYDLAAIDDDQDRQEGIAEMEQKIGALQREADKLLSQLDTVASILAEIERETPRIAGQLGVDLGGAP